MAREWDTLEKMIHMHCRDQHRASGLCAECQQLLDYTRVHLQGCRFGAEKPICANCSYGCYEPTHRQQLQDAIGSARSQMLWRHPGQSLRYWLDSFYQVPKGSVHMDYRSWGGE